MMKLLFVCTGNTCRSAMAQGFFTKAAASDPSLSVNIYSSSAGIYATEGDPASPASAEVMLHDWGIDISGHHAHNITSDDIHSSYLILAMTAAHKHTLLARFPEAAGKIYVLKEFVSPVPLKNPAAADIIDPYGQTSVIYKLCASEINQAVNLLIKKLKSESNLSF